MLAQMEPGLQYRVSNSQAPCSVLKHCGRRRGARQCPAAVAGAIAPTAAAAATVANHSRPQAAPMAAVMLLSPSVAGPRCNRPQSSKAETLRVRATSSTRSQAGTKPLEPLVQVAVTTSSSSVAKAVLLRLQQLGHAQVWATSAANHFIAVSGLALAAQQLQQQHLDSSQRSAAAAPTQQQLHQQHPLLGLSATATLRAHDQPVKDDQKRRLNKLELHVQAAEALNPALLAAGQPGSISTNRTTSIRDILDLMQQQLLEPLDGSSSSSMAKEGGVCVVEARGEQAVTRALKAALSLQAAAGRALQLRPVAGKVVDIVAEKRGQAQVADGLLLLFMWG